MKKLIVAAITASAILLLAMGILRVRTQKSADAVGGISNRKSEINPGQAESKAEIEPARAKAGQAGQQKQLDPAAEAQQGRKELIETLISEHHIFLKVSMSSELPHLFVDRAFYGLTFTEKSEFVNVVWAYYKTENPLANIVVLKDGESGVQIGQYSEAFGGLKMD
jgi:hypothetical protein